MDNQQNPFVMSQQQSQAKREKIGLGHITAMAAFVVEQEANKRIRDNNVTDETEKQQVFQEVIKLYEEAYGHYATYGFSSLVVETPKKKEEDPEAEFKLGYERCIAFNKEQDEKDISPFRRGWRAAREEVQRQEAAKQKEAEPEPDEMYTVPDMSDLLENNAITQLREEVRKLDERLKKLERYAEE